MLTSYAARQFDVSTLRSAVQPRSSAGRRLRDSARPAATSRASSLDACILRRAALDDVLNRDPSLVDTIAGLLGDLGDPGDALAALHSAPALAEDELFAINALLFTAVALRAALPAYATLQALDGDKLDAALACLQGGAGPSRRFRLAEAHDDALGAARDRLSEATRSRVSLASAQRQRLERDYGVRLNAARQLVLPSDDPRVQRAVADPDLKLHHSTAWERHFEPVPDAAQEVAAQGERDARSALDAVELRARTALTAALRPLAGCLEQALDAVATLDVDVALCTLRKRWGGCWPERGERLEVVDGRLPSVAARLDRQGGEIQPVSFALQPGVTLLVGPNMGGKTQTLTLAGTVQWLAQMGWPTPARHVRFRPVDHIAWIGGDPGSLHGGLSRFGAELAALRDALEHPGTGLLLLDEPGSATNPAEGAALTAAIAEHLAGSDHTALLATHFPGLRASVALPTLRVAGLGDVDDETLRAAALHHGERDALQRLMDYRLIPDAVQPAGHDALRIAAAFQLPDALLQRARALLETDTTPP